MQEKDVQPLTPAQARRFLEFISGDRLEYFFTVVVSFGLRQGEAIALRPKDVDLNAGKVQD